MHFFKFSLKQHTQRDTPFPFECDWFENGSLVDMIWN